MEIWIKKILGGCPWGQLPWERKGNRTGQREKVGCNAIDTGLRQSHGSYGAVVALQRFAKWREKGLSVCVSPSTSPWVQAAPWPRCHQGWGCRAQFPGRGSVQSHPAVPKTKAVRISDRKLPHGFWNPGYWFQLLINCENLGQIIHSFIQSIFFSMREFLMFFKKIVLLQLSQFPPISLPCPTHPHSYSCSGPCYVHGSFILVL